MANVSSIQVEPRAYLRQLCNADAREINAPFSLDIDGDNWDVATDGKGIVFVRGATFAARDDVPDCRKFLTEPATLVGECEMEALVSWAEESFSWCELCSDAGVGDPVPAPQSLRCAELFGRPMDRFLVWRFVNELPESQSEPIRAYADKDPLGPVRLETPYWVVMLMPIRPSHGYTLGEAFPGPA